MNKEKTNLENTATSQSHGNANNTNNKDYLIDNWKVENTPFSIIKQEENYFVAVTNKRVSGYFTTKEEAEQEALIIDWVKLMAVILTIVEVKTTKNIEVNE